MMRCCLPRMALSFPPTASKRLTISDGLRLEHCGRVTMPGGAYLANMEGRAAPYPLGFPRREGHAPLYACTFYRNVDGGHHRRPVGAGCYRSCSTTRHIAVGRIGQ